MDNLKGSVKSIIERLTKENATIFSEKLFLEAGEMGIGETYVRKALQELQEEKYVEQVFNSKVIKRLA